jgi:hypothetical protein
LYWSSPTAEELAETTPWYKPTDFVDPVVEVWPENWDVIQLFVQYSTQWRMGFNGPAGLDFNVFHHAMDRRGVAGDQYDQFVFDLRTIEQAALLKIHSK